MIATEEGYTFQREGQSWRCTEEPDLQMLPDSQYRLLGRPGSYPTAALAVADLRRPNADPGASITALPAAAPSTRARRARRRA